MENAHGIRLVGILGGMGPMATLDFLHKVIASTKADTDQEHIPLVVYNIPQIPDRTRAITEGSDSPFPPLLNAVRQLETHGVEAIAIPCNTAHYWYNRLAHATRIPILHIADAVADDLRNRGHTASRCALMATRGTIQTGIYHRVSQNPQDMFQVPDELAQSLTDESIRLVKSGNIISAGRSAHEAVQRIIDKTGVDSIVLACTELPIALQGSPHHAKLIDATLALAQAVVRFSRCTKQLPTAGCME